MREAVGARKTAVLTLTEIPCWIPKARAALWTSIHSCHVRLVLSTTRMIQPNTQVRLYT